jgi:hypothetical protein
MLLTMLLWSATAVAVAGALLVARVRREGMWCWVYADSILAAYNLYEGEWSQAALWGAYLALAVVGIYTWRKRKVGK